MNFYDVGLIGFGLVTLFNVAFRKGKKEEERTKFFLLVFFFFIILKILFGQ